MAIKYWEFEDAPFKEKVKNPKIADIARVFFDNDTEAYRFASLMYAAKKRGLRLKDVPKDIPIATAKRYLDYAVQIGLLKHENSTYELTDRYTKPLRNIASYIKAWMEADNEEDIYTDFPSAKTSKQDKRGGRPASNDEGTGPAGIPQA